MRDLIQIIEEIYSKNLEEGLFNSDPLKKALKQLQKKNDLNKISLVRREDGLLLCKVAQVGENLDFKVYLNKYTGGDIEIHSFSYTSRELRNIGSTNSNPQLKYNDDELVFRGINAVIKKIISAASSASDIPSIANEIKAIR